MDALYQVAVVLLLMSVIIGSLMWLTYNVAIPLLDALDRWWQAYRSDDLNDVFAREHALVVLAQMNGEAYNGIDRCAMCNGNILTENAYAGICDDCWQSIPKCDDCGVWADDAPDWCGECGNCADHCLGWHNCVKARDADWAALMLAIDDETRESEDQR
jgi:hypothetical protein